MSRTGFTQGRKFVLQQPESELHDDMSCSGPGDDKMEQKNHISSSITLDVGVVDVDLILWSIR